jgi:surface antigen
MNVKISLIALGAACSVVLLASPNAFAESAKTEVKKPKQVVVTVKAGDTLSSIAKKHKTTYVRIYNANKGIQNPDVIDVGQKVRIPATKEKLKNRLAAQPVAVAVAQPSAAYVAAQSSYSYPSYPTQTVSYTGGSTAGNTYGWGQCTWYAKNRRADLPNALGNGGSWTGNAAARGYATGNVPRAGAIAEIPGHVMYVESVNKNGTVNISEMNFNGGVGVVNHRTIPASSATYIY